MDTGASSHMNFNQGNMFSLSPCNSKSIMVGNGAIIPVSHIGQTYLPYSEDKFLLKNVLVSNKIIKNLVSVRKFTTDNWVSVSFDPFGFSVKDLNTDAVIQRCDSVGDLYPCTPSSIPMVSAIAFTTVSLPTWHHHLGHPGSSCDNSRKFNNHLLLTYLQSNGIAIRFSCPYTSHQNGKVKRSIRSINNIIRTLLFQASLASSFCTEALLTVVHTLNMLPTTTLSFKTPFEVLFGFFPKYDHLRVFGCLCYPNTPSTSPHKLSPRSTACIYLGPAPDHKGYKCLDLITQRIIISRHVIFDEDHFPYSGFHPSPSEADYNHFIPDDDPPSTLPLSVTTHSTGQ
uniref:Integrase catalytic domain-containing protein n=1 Tax=Lactuca sativa TaxID=4236 RepID=A0A9R1VSI5_LACSA|nr:hypothetical protein LSAT_V11C400213360 [Lactuca sativa]